jgi:hypothetical protein
LGAEEEKNTTFSHGERFSYAWGIPRVIGRKRGARETLLTESWRRDIPYEIEEASRMEICRLFLIGITAALGFVALGLGGFIFSPSAFSLHGLTPRARTKERQTRAKESV